VRICPPTIDHTLSRNSSKLFNKKRDWEQARYKKSMFFLAASVIVIFSNKEFRPVEIDDRGEFGPVDCAHKELTYFQVLIVKIN